MTEKRAEEPALQQVTGALKELGATICAITPRPAQCAWSIRLHEKGGKLHTMPCHHALAEALGVEPDELLKRGAA